MSEISGLQRDYERYYHRNMIKNDAKEEIYFLVIVRQ